MGLRNFSKTPTKLRNLLKSFHIWSECSSMVATCKSSTYVKPDLSDEQNVGMMNYENTSHELAELTVFAIRTTKKRPDGAYKISPYVLRGQLKGVSILYNEFV